MHAPAGKASRIDGGVHEARRHDSGERHVTGEAVYTGDIKLPADALQGFIATSTHAHALIKRLDLDAVRRAPGVVMVTAAGDIPGVNDCSPFAGDDPIFADGLVQYAGQSIFAVAASTVAQARAAAKLAIVEYGPRPAIITIAQAMAAKSFLQAPRAIVHGDPDRAIAGAPHTIRGRIEIGGQEHFYLEGQVAVAVPGEGDEITIHSSTQHPAEVQHKVAAALGVPFHSVTVEVRRMGGAFGGKETQGNLPACVAALFARKTGRVTMVRYDRDDDMRITGKRHDFRIDYSAGFDGAGRLLGVSYEHASRCGMSFDLSGAIADRALCHADNAYYLPAMRLTSYLCKTNTASNTAFRGFGGPQGMIGIERVMDEIARVLDMDPIAVRRINFYPHKDAATHFSTPYKMAVEDCIIQDLFDELETTADYAKRRAQIAVWNKASPILKRGMAITPVKFGISFNNTMLNQAGALVHVYADGSIGLNHGGTEMGQGLFVKVAQVVAEEFQVDLERVKITATTTGKVPNTSATAASSGSDLNGMAARDAVAKIRARLVTHLAQAHQTLETDIAFLPNRIRVGAQEIAFDDAVASAHRARISLSATGFYATPKLHWDDATRTGRPFYYFAYGAAVSEVAIDTLTGENRILRVDILHDCGQSLNPAIDLGQIEGGFVQGAGWLTMEELVWDDRGQLRTHAPSTYKIPCASDRALDMRVNIYGKGRNIEDTIYRSKAAGEPPLMLAISVHAALCDAVASIAGNRVSPDLDAPATPERILVAVERVRASMR
jgi:xanthine dehydrogenase large subunit